MVVSESESEFLSESEPQPMSKRQAAIDGNLENLLNTRADEEDTELSPESKDNPEGTNQEVNSPGNAEQLKVNQEDIRSPAKEDTTRPLVLEERHSLSIAETKKRRESVFSNELLFIPKELARSELQQRTRTLSRYAKNREYHLRMLKFPVGSGRPRYVAKKMKEACHPRYKECGNDPETTSIKDEEFIDEPLVVFQNAREVPLNMPDLEAETGGKDQLCDDEESNIMLYDFVKEEVHSDSDADSDSEKINRKILQSQRESVIRTSSSKRQHYPYFSWHNPDREYGNLKAEIREPWKREPEIQVGCCEESSLHLAECKTEVEEEVVMEADEEVEEQVNHIQELVSPEKVEPPSDEEPQFSQQPQAIDGFYPSTQSQLTHEVRPAVAEVPVQDLAPVRSGSPEDFGQTTLRQQLIHHIVQPNVCNEQAYQSITCNNNAVDRVNQNLRPHPLVDASGAHEAALQWHPQNAENYSNQNQVFHKQQLHIQNPQYLQHPFKLPATQQQHEAILQQQQQAAEDNLQQLRAMYQRIKSREKDQLHHLGKSLKKILDERLICERKHAEEKRLYLLKMEQFKKVEEKLKLDREQLQRQLRSDLTTLELRMADQQRQLEEKALAWSWQHQHQQQLQQQQQHLQRQHLLTQQQQQPQPQQQQQQQHFVHQEPHMNPEAFMMQQHSFLCDPSYIYPTAYQESVVYQQRIQAYHEQQNYHAAESRTTAIELQRRLLLPPPPDCQSSSRTCTEVGPPSRKVRRSRTGISEQGSDPYPRQVRSPLPPAAQILPIHRNPHAQPPEPRNDHFGMNSVMNNYVANFMNVQADR
ncbi:transcription factor SPT20 homolog isoform X1 [Drosophila santomea]|uniref:transcription factor SPT20 homolog isoform X1 n=1 Tax=Drosophila santomea TaxID=129105 RepID=UPI001953D18D|nr:transcription factor SPT20 homolog isoform X1 [Drosophila santomea]XP_039488131.1 transcription factor SPT20 homolog isoform X1 [Drosophila santomea]XP_039488132.1 transcription factor SPT20 homolog isoform X1 [Drosophila santomea]